MHILTYGENRDKVRDTKVPTDCNDTKKKGMQELREKWRQAERELFPVTDTTTVPWQSKKTTVLRSLQVSLGVHTWLCLNVIPCFTLPICLPLPS